MSAARLRLGLLGGSFDPPHWGHLAVAQAAAKAFSLDQVLLAPAGLQPFKVTGAEAPFQDRLEMVTLLCGCDPQRMQASALDAPRVDGLPNYTVDLLDRLRSDAADADLFVLVGQDTFADVPRWRGPERLRTLAQWIVVSRPGFPLTLERANDFEGFVVHRIQDLAIPLASRLLRQKLHRGEDCGQAIPAGVLEYILKRGLYGTGKAFSAPA